MAKTIIINCRIDPESYSLLTKFCQEKKISLSKLIRTAIYAYVTDLIPWKEGENLKGLL